MPSRLTMPFTARGGVGEVHAVIQEPDDDKTIGQQADARGFPVCRANVEFSLDGYDGFLGWVQLVGTRTEASVEYSFELDPLEVFAGIDSPFVFYGLMPVLFDAPYRRDRSQPLDWIRTASCVSHRADRWSVRCKQSRGSVGASSAQRVR